jgi:hypothetical protein
MPPAHKRMAWVVQKSRRRAQATLPAGRRKVGQWAWRARVKFQGVHGHPLPYANAPADRIVTSKRDTTTLLVFLADAEQMAQIPLTTGKFHDQWHNVKKMIYYYSTITETTNYAFRVANPRAANRPAGGWLPEGRIVMTPYLPPNYYPNSVPLIMEFTYRRIPRSGE